MEDKVTKNVIATVVLSDSKIHSSKAPYKRYNISPIIDVEQNVRSLEHHVWSPIDISDVEWNLLELKLAG